MDQKKIKIFLAAFLNYPNAQNINCLSISKYLDHSKFSLYSLNTHFGPKINTKAHLFHCFFPFRVSSFIGFILGVIRCNVIYIPKHRTFPVWVIPFFRFFGKKFFTTIERNMCDSQNESMTKTFGGEEKLNKYFSYFNNIFGITKYIVANSNCGVNINNVPLNLGVEVDSFSYFKRTKLTNIVFIGNLIKRKKINEFIDLAEEFPNLCFHIIGDGPQLKTLKSTASSNVTFHGSLNHSLLTNHLMNMDLLFLPSRSEGFPKVILEAAASGIPSIVYSDYGASSWITNNKNGFVVDSFPDAVNILNKLVNNSNLLSKVSEGSYYMAKKFDWKNIIKQWEEVINNLK